MFEVISGPVQLQVVIHAVHTADRCVKLHSFTLRYSTLKRSLFDCPNAGPKRGAANKRRWTCDICSNIHYIYSQSLLRIARCVGRSSGVMIKLGTFRCQPVSPQMLSMVVTCFLPTLNSLFVVRSKPSLAVLPIHNCRNFRISFSNLIFCSSPFGLNTQKPRSHVLIA